MAEIINEISVGPMLDFKTFFHKKERGTRQQRGYTGQTRLHQNLVPDMHKKDPSLNSKVEDLRGEKSHEKRVLTPKDIGYITQKYNIRNLSKTSPRMLGKTGIKIFFDAPSQKWCLDYAKK